MKYLKKFSYDPDYQGYINGDENEVFLPNVSYVVENNKVYYNPIVRNYFTGIINATNTTTRYLLFSSTNNIKTMKINDIEVTPVSASTFSTTGNNSYYVEFKKPLTSTNKMFYGCTALTGLDLSSFNTSKVTNMTSMFYNCRGLNSLDVSGFDTSNVTDMSSMFYNCLSLTEVRMGGNPSKVSYLNNMFSGVAANGTFYYNSAYDYSKIIGKLPSTWTAVACTLTDGVLIPNE